VAALARDQVSQTDRARILFITGTGTGVGKTLLAASLLYHLRSCGVHALAIKPFCSGSRADVALLQLIQSGELTDLEVNPFYFREPLAPMVAAKRAKQKIELPQVIQSIRSVAARCELLLVEGAGGLLAPLGPGYSTLHLITALQCEVCVVAANRLGTLNHTLLTLRAVGPKLATRTKVILMQTARSPDLSANSNLTALKELLPAIPIISFPYLRARASSLSSIRKNPRAVAGILDLLVPQTKSAEPKRSGALTRQVK
jgi:dethiobiotin synthetase